MHFSAFSILYEYEYAEIMIFFFSIASMSCGPLTFETDSVSIKKYNNKEDNGKKSSLMLKRLKYFEVAMSTILSHVLDSEILKMIFFFKNLPHQMTLQ